MAGAFARYGRVLRAPHVTPYVVAMSVLRLPVGIEGLSTVLFLRHETGSFAVAGAVAGTIALGIVGAPLMARLVDRHGQRRVLVPLAFGHALGLLSLIALAKADAPTAALLACALAIGATVPPAGSVLRALWPRLLRDAPELLSAAFALDSVLIEVMFVFGPLLVAATVAVLAPEAALVLAAAAVVAGTVAFVSLPLSRVHEPYTDHGHGALGALRSPAVRVVTLFSLPLGFCFGSTEVALPAFADAEGARELAGVLIATWSLGSAVGGLFYGARVHNLRLASAYLWLAAILPLTFIPMAAATSLPAMLPLALAAGLCIAPLLATVNQIVALVALPGTASEAQAWPITTLVGGLAGGNAAAGALAEAASWHVAILAGAAVGALGTLLALAGMATIRSSLPD